MGFLSLKKELLYDIFFFLMIIENNLLDLKSVVHLIGLFSKFKGHTISKNWVMVQNQDVICRNQINNLSLQSILAHIIVYLTLKY